MGNSGWMSLHYTGSLFRRQSEQAVASVADKASLDFLGKNTGWSGLSFPTARDLLDPGTNPHLSHLLHWQVGSLLLSHLGSPM